jgi:hypothetical protein
MPKYALRSASVSVCLMFVATYRDADQNSL